MAPRSLLVRRSASLDCLGAATAPHAHQGKGHSGGASKLDEAAQGTPDVPDAVRRGRGVSSLARLGIKQRLSLVGSLLVDALGVMFGRSLAYLGHLA